jgi:hypothetical protein
MADPPVTCSAEPVVGFALRVHPGGGQNDPYTGGCVAVADGDTAVVKMFVFPGGLTRAAVEAVEETLWVLGFDRMRYERRRGGRVVPFEKEL